MKISKQSWACGIRNRGLLPIRQRYQFNFRQQYEAPTRQEKSREEKRDGPDTFPNCQGFADSLDLPHAWSCFKILKKMAWKFKTLDSLKHEKTRLGNLSTSNRSVHVLLCARFSGCDVDQGSKGISRFWLATPTWRVRNGALDRAPLPSVIGNAYRVWRAYTRIACPSSNADLFIHIYSPICVL